MSDRPVSDEQYGAACRELRALFNPSARGSIGTPLRAQQYDQDGGGTDRWDSGARLIRLMGDEANDEIERARAYRATLDAAPVDCQRVIVAHFTPRQWSGSAHDLELVLGAHTAIAVLTEAAREWLGEHVTHAMLEAKALSHGARLPLIRSQAILLERRSVGVYARLRERRIQARREWCAARDEADGAALRRRIGVGLPPSSSRPVDLERLAADVRAELEAEGLTLDGET